MAESVESPERIWIESEGERPYFYHEDELSDVDCPVTEYVRADKLRAERLAEALRKLEEREQRDEDLLRQALEVLSRAHQTAMEQAMKARIPECAEFAGIAQDLDFVVAALLAERDALAAENARLREALEPWANKPDVDAATMLRLIKTIKYLVGIAERGEGRKIADDETPEQFVLGYVKRLEQTNPDARVKLREKNGGRA